MNILAVDTSCQAMIAAIRTDNYYDETENSVQGMQHSQVLMNTISDMCEHAGIRTKDIDLLVCTRGPGSFTGLRIGMATVKGISLGSGKPVASVSTLETHARTVENFDGAVVTVIDAKKQRWYLAAFECHDGKCSRLMEDTDGTEADLVPVLSEYKKVLVVGPDAEAFCPALEKAFPEVSFTLEASQFKTFAQTLIEFGIESFSVKGADDIAQGPVYIRKSDAEVALEEKERNK